MKFLALKYINITTIRADEWNANWLKISVEFKGSKLVCSGCWKCLQKTNHRKHDFPNKKRKISKASTADYFTCVQAFRSPRSSSSVFFLQWKCKLLMNIVAWHKRLIVSVWLFVLSFLRNNSLFYIFRYYYS